MTDTCQVCNGAGNVEGNPCKPCDRTGRVQPSLMAQFDARSYGASSLDLARTLKAIAHDVSIMLGSAQQHSDGEAVTGYTIKTGALHRIIGELQSAGYPVTVPAAPKVRASPASGDKESVREQAVAMTEAQIRDWWSSENGLEDCDLCKIDDFRQVVRAVEAKLYASPLPAVQTVAFKANRPVTPMVKDAATVARHPELQAIYTIPLVEAVR